MCCKNKRSCQFDLSLSSAALDASANFSLAVCSLVSVCSKSSSSWRTFFVKVWSSLSVYRQITRINSSFIDWLTYNNKQCSVANRRTCSAQPALTYVSIIKQKNDFCINWILQYIRLSSGRIARAHSSVEWRIAKSIWLLVNLPARSCPTNFHWSNK